jgi:protein transport protein SEC24
MTPVPPVAAKPFVANDDGNATPRFIRSTLHHFPASKEVATNAAQPMAVVVTPMAKLEEGEAEIRRADFSDPRVRLCLLS